MEYKDIRIKKYLIHKLKEVFNNDLQSIYPNKVNIKIQYLMRINVK